MKQNGSSGCLELHQTAEWHCALFSRVFSAPVLHRCIGRGKEDHVNSVISHNRRKSKVTQLGFSLWCLSCTNAVEALWPCKVLRPVIFLNRPGGRAGGTYHLLDPTTLPWKVFKKCNAFSNLNMFFCFIKGSTRICSTLERVKCI